MKVIILAAGEGTRLRPYTEKRPKCLVEVEGRSLLDRQLEVLRREGLSDIVVVKGYLEDEWSREGVREYVNPRYASTNMVHTLFCAERELEGELIVSYGDIVYSNQVLRSLLDSRNEFSVVVDLSWRSYWEGRLEDPLQDAETLRLGEGGKIVEIGQKPTSYSEIEGQYIGLMKFSTRGVEILKEVYRDCLKTGSISGRSPEKAYMTDLLQEVISRGFGLSPVFIRNEWIEIDTTEDLTAQITRDRLRQIDSHSV